MFSEPLGDDNFHQLGIVGPAATCRHPWEALLGEGRMRWCPRCKAKVYWLQGLTPEEARELLRRSEPDRLCARFYRRPDGAFLTRDLRPVWSPSRHAETLKRTARVTLVVLAVFVVLGVGLFSDHIGRYLFTRSTNTPSGDPPAPAHHDDPDSKCGCRWRNFAVNNAY